MVVPINGNLKVNHSEQSGIERTLRRIYEVLFVSNFLIVYLFIRVKFIATAVELLMGIVTVLLLLVRHKKNVVIPYNTVWYGVFVIFCALSTLWSQYLFSDIAEFLLRMVIILVTITSISIYADTENDVERLVNLFILSATAIVFIELSAIPASEWTTGFLGSYASMNNSNDISFWVSCAGMMAFYKAYIKNIKPMCILFILFMIFVLLSSSRKALLILLISPVIMILLATYKKNYPLRIIGFLVVIVAVFYIIMTNTTLYQVMGSRVVSMFDFFFKDANDGSLYKRRFYITIAKKMFSEAPVLGKGFGNFAKILKYNPINSFNHIETYSHNNYWQILSELGIIGFILYYSMYVLMLARLIKRVFVEKNKLCYLFLSFMIILVIFEYGIVSEQSKYVQPILAMAYAATYVKNNKQTVIS